MMMRRAVTRTMAAIGLTLGLAGWQMIPAMAESVSVNELMKPGPLEEMVLGNPDAKVTIVEYASVSCSHCGDFYNEVFPTLKAKYIDTGKVRYILREFIGDSRGIDPYAAAGFALARCSGDKDKYFAITGLLFSKQKMWLVNNPELPLRQLMLQAGISKDAFTACVSDEKMVSALKDISLRGIELGIEGTPSFFINGELHVGTMSVPELEAILDPLLK